MGGWYILNIKIISGDFYFFFRCRARVRTNPSGDRVSIVEEDHNHEILIERRKKGSLKRVYEERKLAKTQNKNTE